MSGDRSVSWSLSPLALLGEGAKWLDAVVKARRDRKVWAAANVLYHAGAIVVSLRAQRDRMYELLSPLRNFDPAQWPDERRQEAIEALVSFARNPSQIFSDMRTHAQTLRGLSAQPSESVAPLRDQLVEVAQDVAHLGAAVEEEQLSARAAELEWAGDLGSYITSGTTRFGQVSPDLAGPDTLIQSLLPALLWLVHSAHDQKEVVALRGLAGSLLVTRSRQENAKLDDVVRKAEDVFGELRGILLHQFPDLPSPTWADARAA